MQPSEYSKVRAAPPGRSAWFVTLLRLVAPVPATVGRRLAPLSVLALALMLCLIQPAPRSPSAEQHRTPLVLGAATQRVAAGEDVQAAIQSAGPGATIVLAAGVHRGQSLVPLDSQTITGEAGAVLDGTGAPTPFAISGSASDVVVSHLEIRNYTKPIWGPNEYRHQGAIHGAEVNAGGGFVAIASNWRIEANDIHHNAGWGVAPGDGFVIRQNTLHHNGMAGIGGGDFNGGLIESNDIYSNNDPSNSTGDFNYETGRPWDWAWNAAGIKVANVNCRSMASTGSCSGGTALVIRSNHVHDNAGVGIWCDINCNDVVIEKNLVERNIGRDSVGIFYEISQNGTIRDNVVREQGASGNYLSPSGIMVWSSDGVLVERNRIEGTANAIVGNARPRVQPHAAQHGGSQQRGDHARTPDPSRDRNRRAQRLQAGRQPLREQLLRRPHEVGVLVD
ncbi:MAG: right-handed parallel beta-helix repeat-containing protein [Acidimicrobiales bacterium]